MRMKHCLLLIAAIAILAPADGRPSRSRPEGCRAGGHRDIDAKSRRWTPVLGLDPPQIHLTKPGRELEAPYRAVPSITSPAR